MASGSPEVLAREAHLELALPELAPDATPMSRPSASRRGKPPTSARLATRPRGPNGAVNSLR